MKDYIENCPYCIGKAIQEGKIQQWWQEDDIEGNFKVATPKLDNHGIFVFYSCEDCDKEQRSEYDPIIFNDYDAYTEKAHGYGERFEPED